MMIAEARYNRAMDCITEGMEYSIYVSYLEQAINPSYLAEFTMSKSDYEYYKEGVCTQQ